MLWFFRGYSTVIIFVTKHMPVCFLVFFCDFLYGLYHGIHHHLSPPFEIRFFEPFPSIAHANPTLFNKI